MRLLKAFPVFLILVISCSHKTVQESNFAELKIYHTNDVHAHLTPDSQGRGGFAFLASVLRAVRQQEQDALILDAGDYYKKGSLPAQLSKDDVTSKLLSEMPYYDARAVGNNEIKVGIPKLLEWAKTREKAPLLSANFIDKDGKTVFQPYIIFKKAGLKVGVIGLTAQVPIDDSVQGDPKTDPRAPYKILDPNIAALSLIAELRPQVDVLILLSHQHFHLNKKLAAEHPEVDLIVSGHSHVLTPEQKQMGGNLVVETGEFGHRIGLVTLVYDKQDHKVASLDSTFWPVGDELQLADPHMTELIRDAYKKWAPDAFVKLGEATHDLTIINRENTFEGSLNDYVADKFCEKVHCDVAIVNRDLLREAIYKGKIDKEAAFLAVPYDDEIEVMEIPKGKFIELLKKSITTYYNNNNFMGYSFSKMSVDLRIQDKKVKSLRLDISSPKKILKVAFPAYMATHCTEFFKSNQCPLPSSSSVGKVKNILEEDFEKEKIVEPPPSDRVVVHDGSAAPAPIED